MNCFCSSRGEKRFCDCLGPRPCLDALYGLDKVMDRIANLRTGVTHSSCGGPLLNSV